MSSKSPVLKSAGSMGIATLMSRVLGLVREQVFAYFFGAGHAVDAFNIAFRIPNLLRDLFAEGALSAALVPTFIRARKEEGDARAWQVARRVFLSLFVVVSVLALAGVLFAEPLVDLYAGAYRGTPGKFELTVFLTRVMFPFFPLVALAAAFMGILNALGLFFLPAFASALFNAASILSGVVLSFLAPRYGYDPIAGMAAGVVIGGCVQAFCQVPSLSRRGLWMAPDRTRKISFAKDRSLKDMLRMMVPGTVGLAATQIGILVNTILATGLGVGAVSWLNYAFRLMQFPIGVFGVSLAQATLPQVSRQWVDGDASGFMDTVSRSLRHVFAINLPAAAGLSFLAVPIIETIFEYGRFTSIDTASTARALAAYSIGLAAYSAVKVLVPVFYAMGNTRVPVISSLLSVFVNIALSFWFSRSLGFVGLALATSVSAFLNFGFLAFSLKSALRAKRGVEWSLSALAGSFLKHLVASTLMGLACLKTWQALASGLENGGWSRSSPWMRSILVGIVVVEGIFLVLWLAQILKLEETQSVLNALKSRVLKRRS